MLDKINPVDYYNNVIDKQFNWATTKEVIGVEERKMLQTMEEAARLMSPQKQAEFVAFCEGMAFVARQQAAQAERKQ